MHGHSCTMWAQPVTAQLLAHCAHGLLFNDTTIS